MYWRSLRRRAHSAHHVHDGAHAEKQEGLRVPARPDENGHQATQAPPVHAQNRPGRVQACNLGAGYSHQPAAEAQAARRPGAQSLSLRPRIVSGAGRGQAQAAWAAFTNRASQDDGLLRRGGPRRLTAPVAGEWAREAVKSLEAARPSATPCLAFADAHGTGGLRSAVSISTL